MSTKPENSMEAFPETLPGQTITGKWARVTMVGGKVLIGLVGPSRQLGRAFIATQALLPDGLLEPEVHFHAARKVEIVQAISLAEAQASVDVDFDLIAAVKRDCAHFFGVSIEAIEGKCREERFVRPRHATFLILREKGMSSPAVGTAIGNHDHGTVLAGVISMENRMLMEPDTANIIKLLRHRYKIKAPVPHEERKAA